MSLHIKLPHGNKQVNKVDFIKSPYWYNDYIESLYEEVLVYLFDWFEGQLSYGEPVSKIVQVIGDELTRLTPKVY